MSNNKNSLDGFIPRRSGNRLGELHQVKKPDAIVKPIDRSLHTGRSASTQRVGVPRQGKEMGIARTELEDSLRSIDDESLQNGEHKSRR